MIEKDDKLWENDAKMPPQELIRLKKWRVSKGVITYVERKSSLHDKRVSNDNLVVIKVISMYTMLENDSNNGDQQLRS